MLSRIGNHCNLNKHKYGFVVNFFTLYACLCFCSKWDSAKCISETPTMPSLISWASSDYFNLTFWLNCPPLQAAFPTLHALAIRDWVESESNVISSHQKLWILLVWYAKRNWKWPKTTQRAGSPFRGRSKETARRVARIPLTTLKS